MVAGSRNWADCDHCRESQLGNAWAEIPWPKSLYCRGQFPVLVYLLYTVTKCILACFLAFLTWLGLGSLWVLVWNRQLGENWPHQVPKSLYCSGQFPNFYIRIIDCFQGFFWPDWCDIAPTRVSFSLDRHSPIRCHRFKKGKQQKESNRPGSVLTVAYHAHGTLLFSFHFSAFLPLWFSGLEETRSSQRRPPAKAAAAAEIKCRVAK